ncbi:uncharacterized protein AMSG_04811 [Thecamonas trahens ATCC 50062]|uniref:MRH domain-containing protein n=1 Tax=Thecamonas trahens ATCC 50062 TaxID=461836 RepID=A0A0L0D7K0_THETB|nr:hypothetical protein AMSG_04811 [Thecamonas trahens ATCC 50062]KNC48362.1 hypothetical protein AMSG_04811 [Thecamonas trahens ATCC 50062]|eukprot:XP_013758482.1 hypothetical protein AMSG_04811 [Thecamonas trahens ATCC 50062]
MANDDGVHVCVKNLYYPDGSAYFPVSKLEAPGNEPYTLIGVFDDPDVYDFRVNLCESVECGDKGSHFSGCQNYTDSRTHYRGLGDVDTITWSTVVPDQGTGFTVSFSDGTPCSSEDAAGNAILRSMRIFAICSPGDTTPRLEFIGETGYCEYDFNLFAAEGPCPIAVGEPTTPQPCHSDSPLVVTSGAPGAADDFYYPVWELEQSLASPLTVQTDILGVHFDFEINMCGTVSCPESGLAAPAGCAHPGNGPMFALGALETVAVEPYPVASTMVAGETVDVMDGFKLTYTGGEACDAGNPGTKSQLEVYAVCDSLMRDVDPPRVVFGDQSSACKFEFLVYSHLACPLPVDGGSGAVPMYDSCPEIISTGKGHHYDLVPLRAEVEQPYVVTDTRFSMERQYRFNLCGAAQCSYQDCGDDKCYKVESSLVPESRASSCVMWQAATGEVHGIISGRMDMSYGAAAKPDLSGFTLEYIGGDPCESDEERNVPAMERGRRTIIHGVCDPNAHSTVVEFVSESYAPCVTVIKVTSAKACPIADRPRVATTCAQRVLFSNTVGKAYNFHNMDKDSAITVDVTFDGVDHEYTFSFCDSLACPGAQRFGDGQPTFCHSYTSASNPSTPQVEVLGTIDSTTFLTHADDSGYTVVYSAPEPASGAVTSASGAVVHVHCDATADRPVATLVGVSASGILELMVRANEEYGGCASDFAGSSGGSSSSSPYTAGSKHSSTSSFTTVFVIIVVIAMVGCLGVVALKMYVSAHPESSLPDPTAPCAKLPCANEESNIIGGMMAPVSRMGGGEVININNDAEFVASDRSSGSAVSEEGAPDSVDDAAGSRSASGDDNAV